jgi:hypothetical protein
VKFGIKLCSGFNLKKKSHANKPTRDGDLFYLLDLSEYLEMTDKKYFREEISIIGLLS